MTHESNRCKCLDFETYVRNLTSEGSDEPRILEKAHFKSSRFLNLLVRWSGLFCFLEFVVVLLFGGFIFNEFLPWLLATILSFGLLALMKSLIEASNKKNKSRQHEFWIAITQNHCIIKIAPTSYVEMVEHLNFSRQISGVKNPELTEEEMEAFQNLKNGMQTFCISRAFEMFTSKNQILLNDEDNEVFIPYNKHALNFLKNVAFNKVS